MGFFETVAAGALAELLGAAAWKALSARNPGAVFERLYRRWREESTAEEQPLRSAFEEFFSRQPTRNELRKVLDNRYADVDVRVLEKELRASCQWAGCPVPPIDLYEQLDLWVRDLDELLKQTPEYRARYQVALENAIRELGRSEAVVRNHSRARELYLKAVVKQHWYIRFCGMAEVSGPPEVERTRVFVMPRVARQPEYGRPERQPQPFAAGGLLQGEQAAARVVLLGGPGSGKTTLLESFALALAAPGRFPWAEQAPDLLPVFYRVRDLDKDLQARPGATVWDCLHDHCSQRLGLTLPLGFFPREMESRGLLALFDGLDEAANPARRIHIAELVSGFADSLSSPSRVVITSRPYDYRRRFDPDTYRHFDLCDFDDDEIQVFIRAWTPTHEPDPSAATAKAERLWSALESRPDIKPLAGNALLLTMIVRVHFGLGALPDSRLDLYRKCTETLLKDWLQAKDLPPSPLGFYEKQKFLARLAYEMQAAAGEALAGDMMLQILRDDLARRLDSFLKAEELRLPVDEVIERLHARDAILVQCGGDQFGFLHRSFQEYFAAQWMAQELSDEDFAHKLLEEPAGWNETLCLAVAQLSSESRRRMLAALLAGSRIEMALACLNASPQVDPWLRRLVQFLSKYYWEGCEYVGLPANECADSCAGRPQTAAVLRGLFDPQTRDGRALAAALELAEELARRGNQDAAALLEGFFAESQTCGLRTTEKMEWIDNFYLDRYLVTNADYECMVPAHRAERNPCSDAHNQPVIYVNWHEAQLFCRWRGPRFRLPTEEEWYKAAAWDRAAQAYREYPWEGQWDPAKCNTHEGGPGKTTPVDFYPQGVSPYGCYDMAGNVWEWTATPTEVPWARGEAGHVLRGGSWGIVRGVAACAFRGREPPCYRGGYVGFRCART